MSAGNGYNPLRWNCRERGCFNVKKRPKIEIFADCLPGKIAFSDVDATVEVNGRFLFLEFKEGDPRELQIGQRLYLQRLTGLSRNIKAVVVFADAQTMNVGYVQTVQNGLFRPIEACSTEELRKRIKIWATRASSMPRLRLAA